MKPRVYLDTSVISAYFDTRTPERMALTRAAWERFEECEMFLSDLVTEELRAASSPLREKMLAAVSSFTVLPVSDAAELLADRYVKQGIFPARYFDDALHVAIASVNRTGILLSWNFSHLVKVKTRRLVALVNAMENHMPVEIIAPPEL
jgi:predicted nucleic acid-binding protein